MSNYSNIWTQSNCLSKSQLLNYIRQKLDHDEVYLVESHLNDCPICSDALDGLMEEDIQITEESLTEVKTDLEKRILERHPEKKITPLVNRPFKEAEPIKPGVSMKSDKRYRWMVAASLLLLMGLGGYSIFSYIKSQDHQLAQNKMAADSQPVDYNKPKDTADNEIRQIKSMPPINRPDAVASTPAPKHEEHSYKNIPVEPLSPARNEESKDADVSQRESTAPASAVVKQPLSNEKQSVDEQVSNAAPVSQANDYMEEKKAVEPYKEALAKKRSSTGLSNSKPAAFNQSSNQMSYPHQPNNVYQNNAYRNAETIEAEDPLASKDAKQRQNNYEIAMQYVNGGEYRKSIPYFEKALKNTQGIEKEDIQFQLAEAYLKAGMDRKAERLFETLAAGTKYKTEATEKLRKLTK